MSPQQGDAWDAQRDGEHADAGRRREPASTTTRDGALGASLVRADGPAKVTGAFLYSSDLRVPGMLHGATLRSPLARGRIARLDVRAAAQLPGVHAVLTHEDVPGCKLVGSVLTDQPVLAFDEVRHHGEPIAVVAADDEQAARDALDRIELELEPLPVVDDPEHGEPLRTITVVHGDPDARGVHVVCGEYEVGRQDQAFLGPESGLAIPDPDGGGVELHIATQWLHVDRDQVAAGLGLPPDRVRLVLAGVGGAFGAREDLSMQLHACLLALRTGRPVRMAYPREESFVGHVHRHPARLRCEHHADADGTLVNVRAELLLDGGAYASSSPAVIANATTLAAGPYRTPNARLAGTVVTTNNPPSGAMRGFGAVQVAIAYEAQMDRLARAVGIDPLALRRRNAIAQGDTFPFGQTLDSPGAVPELLDALQRRPLPPRGDDDRPAPAFGATDPARLRRGVGYACAFKNVAFSEGFDDPATARVTLHAGDEATVFTAATEVGQGVLGVQEQVVREELGTATVHVAQADTTIASAGSASASRLTWMVTGAIRAACAEVRARRDGGAAFPITAEATYRHHPTTALDPETGHGNAHAAFAFVAHRAVVEVDLDLGLARVVELACAQDVGRVVNPLALTGQLEGGGVQGIGLALTEDLISDGGIVQSGSFGGYRIPTLLDAPSLPTDVLELADPGTPYGLRGVGELPALSSTPAVLAALRDATGKPLTRAPATPEDLASP